MDVKINIDVPLQLPCLMYDDKLEQTLLVTKNIMSGEDPIIVTVLANKHGNNMAVGESYTTSESEIKGRYKPLPPGATATIKN